MTQNVQSVENLETSAPAPSRIPLVLGVLATLAILGVVGKGWWEASHPPVPPLIGTMDAKTLSVSAKIPGRVTAVHVSEGSLVKAGETVATIGIPELEAKLEQARALERAAQAKASLADEGARTQQIEAAKADLARARAARDLARKTWQRVDALHREGLLPAQRHDEMRAQLRNAEETVTAAAAKVSALEEGARRQEKEAAHALAAQAKGGVSEVSSLASEKDVRSPVSGEVTRVVLEPGEIAPAGFPVVLVTDLTDRWAVFNVREDELPGLAVGTEVVTKVPAIGKTVPMTVYWINPRGDYATWRATRQSSGYDLRTFEVRLRPTADVEGLRPGMSVIIDRQTEGNTAK